MKWYSIQNTFEVQNYLSFDYQNFLPAENIILYFGAMIPWQTRQEIIEKTTSASSNVSVVMEDQQILAEAHLADLEKWGIKKIIVRQWLSEISPEAHDFKNWRFVGLMDRSLPGLLFKMIQPELINRFELIPELVLTPEGLPLLFSTLSLYAQFQVPYVILNPFKLDIKTHAKAIREAFDLYQMYSQKKVRLYISPEHPLSESWHIKLENQFGGPRYIDIDLSNSCNHDCVFCGTHSREIKDRLAGNVFHQDFLRKRQNENVVLNYIERLPEAVKFIQFGGVGDPGSHPSFIEIISKVRERNFPVSVLSNFSFFNRDQLSALSELGSRDPHKFFFIVNISGATPETYVKTRPGQSERTFHKLLEDIRFTSDYALKNERGIGIWLQCVVNILNYEEMPLFIALARDIGALNVYFKPMQIHERETEKYLIPPELELSYLKQIRLAVYFAKILGVGLNGSEWIDEMLAANAHKLTALDQSEPFELQVSEALARFELLNDYITGRRSRALPFERSYSEVKFFNPSLPYDLPASNQEVTTKPMELFTISADDTTEGLDLGILNKQIPVNFYKKNKCYIGFDYLRIDVDGKVLPCCVSPYAFPNDGLVLDQVWFSERFEAFRSKLKKIDDDQFFLKDQEWTFCQYCPHMEINKLWNGVHKKTTKETP